MGPGECTEVNQISDLMNVYPAEAERYNSLWLIFFLWAEGFIFVDLEFSWWPVAVSERKSATGLKNQICGLLGFPSLLIFNESSSPLAFGFFCLLYNPCKWTVRSE